MDQKITNPRVLFLGMAGPTSAIVLEALLAAGADVCAVVVGVGGAAVGPAIAPLRPAATIALVPIANPFVERSIAGVAWERGLPAFELRRPGDPAALAALAEARPDVACVACFPRRIPAALLALAPRGFLNYHPSLLPAHRGPEPLFWTFQAGEGAGVTIHFMDEGLDTGAIAAQAPLDLPDGVAGARAERLCAELGGRMLAEVLGALAAGTLSPRPQPPGGAYEPSPSAADFRLDTRWSARRAFNFMRGTAEWGQPYPVLAGGAELALAEAIAVEPAATIEQPYVRVGGELRVRFAEGILHAYEVG